MLFKVEYILIPETYVRMSMRTEEFDKFIRTCLEDDCTIYEYKGTRYIFIDEDFVLEEQK